MHQGVDIIIAQGYEAGGHTGEVATHGAACPTWSTPSRRCRCSAAGGIGTGRQMAAAMALGAEGVWTGSIWLTVAENDTGGDRDREAARGHVDRHGAVAGLHRQAGPPAAHRVDRGLGGARSRRARCRCRCSSSSTPYADRKMGSTADGAGRHAGRPDRQPHEPGAHHQAGGAEMVEEYVDVAERLNADLEG